MRKRRIVCFFTSFYFDLIVFKMQQNTEYIRLKEKPSCARPVQIGKHVQGRRAKGSVGK